MPVAQSKLIKERLAAELARCTREKFKSIPSHQQFAKHFFASSKYSLKVSGEAVRKWFKGEAFPDLDCLAHLIEWMNLDMTRVFLQPIEEKDSATDPSQANPLIKHEHFELALKIIELIEIDKKSNSHF